MSDDKNIHDAAKGSGGFLAMLVGGPIVMARLGEWTHIFCEDCECWVNCDEYGLCNSLLAQSFPLPSTVREIDGSWGPMRTRNDGPLWPGCRGFKHRPGTPGPSQRYHEAVKARIEAGLKPSDGGNDP